MRQHSGRDTGKRLEGDDLQEEFSKQSDDLLKLEQVVLADRQQMKKDLARASNEIADNRKLNLLVQENIRELQQNINSQIDVLNNVADNLARQIRFAIFNGQVQHNQSLEALTKELKESRQQIDQLIQRGSNNQIKFDQLASQSLIQNSP